MLPKIKASRERLPTSATIMIKTESKNVESSNWFAATEAFFASFFPRYWEQTTAPPVESAARSWMISVLIESTKDTPETAASPTAETMTTSAMPTKTARICSIIKGIRRRRRSFFENNTITWIQRTHGKRSGAAASGFFAMDSMGFVFQQILRNLLKRRT